MSNYESVFSASFFRLNPAIWKVVDIRHNPNAIRGFNKDTVNPTNA